jgi:hypothetical protein
MRHGQFKDILRPIVEGRDTKGSGERVDDVQVGRDAIERLGDPGQDVRSLAAVERAIVDAPDQV